MGLKLMNMQNGIRFPIVALIMTWIAPIFGKARNRRDLVFVGAEVGHGGFR